MAYTGTRVHILLYFVLIILVLLCADKTLVSVNWIKYFGFCYILWKKIVDYFKVGHDCMYHS
jgi:hypothetical protein